MFHVKHYLMNPDVSRGTSVISLTYTQSYTQLRKLNYNFINVSRETLFLERNDRL